MPKRKTLEEFIMSAKIIHGDNYEYNYVDYKKNNIKVEILCKKHKPLFSFFITPASHLQGVGCKKCSLEKKSIYKTKTKEVFIKQAIDIHGDKYDYKKTEYIIGSKKVNIFCKKHEYYFSQTPNVHLKGFGCNKCSSEKRKDNLKEFIEKSKLIHGDKYDYSLVKYDGVRVRVNIICKKHNIIFNQYPNTHTRGSGCTKCARESAKLLMFGNTEDFIYKAKIIHGDKYNYDFVVYERDTINVKIFCNSHNIYFMQRPSSHLGGSGCIKCRDKKMTTTRECFIEKANLIHGDRYGYDFISYKRNNIKVEIFCKKHKYSFLQTPVNHLNGKGCPKCSESIGERCISEILNRLGVNFEREKRFKSCRSKNPLPFDFYIHKYNICIEFDGIQHDMPLSCFGGENAFKELQKRDKIKTDWCNENNINLLRINYIDLHKVEQILIDKIFKNK